MRKRTEILNGLVNPGLIAIIRATSDLPFEKIFESFIKGGLKAAEITMTTPGALEAIARLKKSFGKDLIIGVGTVLDSETCRSAMLAGAEFVVTPAMRPEVIQICRRYGCPVMTGGYTPTEILSAWEAGSDFVKVFPADGLGPNYIKAVKAPLPQVEIIPTGGVDVNTAADFIKAGCSAVAAGSSLMPKDMIANNKWDSLSELCKKFVDNIAAARK